MKKIIRKLAISMSAFALLLAPAGLMAAPAFAETVQIQDNLCAGASFNVNDTNCTSTNDAGETVNSIITNVINIFSIVVGVVSVIMIIIGGLKYITSGGDSGNVSGAKNTILYAIIGLVIVALSQVIVRFVLSKVSSATSG